jgi:predicted SnoaL-like aldol condensation-catalyzing enzyme
VSELAVGPLIAITFSGFLLAASTFVVPARADPGDPREMNSTAAQRNRQVVLDFYEQFFNLHDLTAADRYISDNYRQHNPNVPDGRQPFVAAFQKIFAQLPQRHSQIVRAVTEGDIVVLHVKLTKGTDDRGTAVVDIFRLQDGKIVEHWDVQQPIPEKRANENTMF